MTAPLVLYADINARQVEILQRLADGSSAKGVAFDMYLSKHTVQNYIQRAIVALGANSRTHAVAIALRSGLIK